jgi:3-deoxy-D-arabino-heptulosonate 7-phosphate (DAHP) synthase
MEKTWEGLVSYAKKFLSPKRIILIHRGVDVPEKEKYRNAPVHYLAMKVKKHTGCLLFFDPSHSHGPLMRENIVEETIKAMKMKINNDEYLYDGILIEVGRSLTDTEQHISLDEFKYLVKELVKFREL